MRRTPVIILTGPIGSAYDHGRFQLWGVKMAISLQNTMMKSMVTSKHNGTGSARPQTLAIALL